MGGERHDGLHDTEVRFDSRPINYLPSGDLRPRDARKVGFCPANEIEYPAEPVSFPNVAFFPFRLTKRRKWVNCRLERLRRL